jgi:phosphatidate phosphatase APP1
MMENPQLNTIPEVVGDLRSGQEVVLYPTFGHMSSDEKSWHVEVAGAVFEPGTSNLGRRMFVRVLQQLLGISSEDLDSDYFQRRVDRFLANTERGKRIWVHFGASVHQLPRASKRSGHFHGTISLNVDEVRDLVRSHSFDTDWLDFRVATDSESEPVYSGAAQLIEPSGVSVISDIDDTIKQSEVADRRKLLHNTFLREFEPVKGMAEVFRDWADQGAAFHYVSSSPWQLYGCLSELLERAGFPRGSFHLRPLHWRNPSLLRLFVARCTRKRRVIRSIVQTFPRREFVLVGDSGEKDPEIYGAIARQFPDQVKRIKIRVIRERPMSSERISRAFRDVNPSVYQMFADPEELY